MALAILGVLTIAGPASSQATLGDVKSLPSVQAVQNHNWGTTERFYLESYGDGVTETTVTRGDGAAGLFVNEHTTSCTDNGGSVLQDSGDNCFRRQNVNGDLRQWGFTKNSRYDVYRPMGTFADTDDAAPRLNNVLPLLVELGIKTFHTNGVSLRFEHTLVIPAGAAFTCDTPPANNAAHAEYRGLPGSLVIAHGKVIDAQTNNDAEVYGCAVLIPEWYADPANAGDYIPDGKIFTPPTQGDEYSYDDLERIRANMVLGGDVALRAGSGAKIHDISIMGFDNCLYLFGASQSLISNVNLDCSIGLYSFEGGGNTALRDVRSVSFLTRQTSTSNSAYWDITNIEASADPEHLGACELTLDSVNEEDFPLGLIKNSEAVPDGRGDPYFYPAWVARLKDAGISCLSAGTGRFGNDAGWNVEIVNDDPEEFKVVLVGSKYAASNNRVATRADWNARTGVLRITGSIANLAVGMKVDLNDDGEEDARIVGIVQRCTGPDPDDGYNGCVVVSPAPLTASPGQPASVTVKFWNPEDVFVAASEPCDGDTKGYCFFLNAAQRPVAGNSDAGKASARLPASRGGQFGAGFLIDTAAGLRAVNTFSFGHYYGYAIIDSNSCSFFQEGGDSNGELDAGNDVFMYVVGSSSGCTFVGNKNGKSGASIVLDTFGLDDRDPEDLVHAQDISAADLQPLGKYNIGDLDDGIDTTGWPRRGTMRLCRLAGTPIPIPRCDLQSEYVFYEKVGDTFRVTVRGRMGTAPSIWNTNAKAFITRVSGGSDKHPDRSTATTFANLSNPSSSALSQFEILHGSATLAQVGTNSNGYSFVSTNTSGVTITATNQPKGALYFEDENASALTTVSLDSSFANYVRPGVVNLPLSYRQWFGTPQRAGPTMGEPPTEFGFDQYGASGTGKVTVLDTTNWPETGILRVDSEYIGYHIESKDTLFIEQRGMCGSTPAEHDTGNTGVIVTYMNVVFGCPATGQGQPQFTIDATGSVGFGQSNLAHGQVYMSLNGSNIQLCPLNGKGLIIDGVLRAVPGTGTVGCAIVPTSNLSAATGRYYVYAIYHQVDVKSIASASSHVRLYVSDNADFYAGSPITCYGITGTPGANVVEDANTLTGTDGTGTYIDLTDQTFGASGTGACSYVALEFSTTAHTTATNGVEIRGTNPTRTLVGMVYADASHTVNDSLTKRHVASWFNRKIKTCFTKLSGNITSGLTATSYAEVSSSLQCQFVTWANTDLSWSVAGSAFNQGTSGGRLATSVGFDSTSANETEFTESTGNTGSQRLSIAVSGTKTGLGEDISHYITMLYKVNTGDANYRQDSSVQVRIPQ